MNPFQQSSELCFQISPDPYQEHTTPQNLIHHPLPDHHPHHHHHHVDSSPDKSIKTRQTLRSNTSTTHDGSTTKNKMIHRDIERQRRQEMAARCASLRSLLPTEYIKGKRSISDHMNEAVKYIKHLQESVSVLGARRDELRKPSDSRGEERSSSGRCLRSRVTVRSMAEGIEVLLSGGVVGEQDLALSRVLEIVLREGFVVMSCSSTKVNRRLLHTIHAEVSDRNCNNIDLAELQEKLMEASFQYSRRFSSTRNFSN